MPSGLLGHGGSVGVGMPIDEDWKAERMAELRALASSTVNECTKRPATVESSVAELEVTELVLMLEHDKEEILDLLVIPAGKDAVPSSLSHCVREKAWSWTLPPGFAGQKSVFRWSETVKP